MKKLLLLLLPAIILSVNGCEKPGDISTGKGQVEFTINSNDTGLKSASDSIPSTSYHLLLTISTPDGIPVVEDKIIAVYRFGEGFTSEKLELESGSFMLTKFMLINPSGVVIYAAPLHDSPRSYLVNTPLPFRFSVESGQVTSLSPEVLSVNGASPSEFGYVEFGFHVVNPLTFYVLAMLDNPLIMAPTQITDANLIVSSHDGWMHQFHLERKVNKVLVKGGYEQYFFEVLKDGYSPSKFRFSAEELSKTSENNPLVLTIGEGPMEFVTIKPGPEKGMDAMISDLEPDKNFGTWPYFEASFLSESPLTVMRTNRSLIRFDMNAVPKGSRIDKVMLTLYFDKPLGWDSIYTDFAWFGAVFQKITAPWEENRVNWNNQPPVTEMNQVYVSPHPEMNTNVRTYDITSLYIPAKDSAMADYGFMFRLYPSPQFAGFRFASSDFPEPSMRPELKVFYSYLPD